MEISESLKRFRQELKLSQRQLSEKIGVPYQSYQTYEYGSATPSAKVIIKIASAFDVSADYLLGLSDEPRPKKYDEQEVAEAFALRDVFSAMLKRAIIDVSKPKGDGGSTECGDVDSNIRSRTW